MGTRKKSDSIALQLYSSLAENYRREKKIIDSENHDYLPKLCNATLTAFPMALMVWEAYLHERIFTPFSPMNLDSHLIMEIKDKIENWDIETKTYVFPKWIFGESFDKSKQPFQDFKKLIQIRNSIVHFKWDKPPLNVIKDLAQRNITLNKENAEMSWTMELSSIDCFKWAINTLVNMIETFELFFPEKHRFFALHFFQKVD